MWWKQNKWKVLVPVLIVVVLAVAFFWGGSMPEDGAEPTQSVTLGDTQTAQPTPTPAATPSATPQPTPAQSSAPEPSQPPREDEGMELNPGENGDGGMTVEPEKPDDGGMELEPETGGGDIQIEVVPGTQPKPVEPVDPEEAPKGDGEYSCTLSISCATILDNMDLCDPDKTDLVPADGWILEAVTVSFKEGENVFDALQRACKENKIHLEFANTPLYNSAYIEGIHNIYEFDVGELSGWMYKVNDWFPNYGCSRYLLKDGDVICWEYTCELGYDIGGGNVNQVDE